MSLLNQILRHSKELVQELDLSPQHLKILLTGVTELAGCLFEIHPHSVQVQGMKAIDIPGNFSGQAYPLTLLNMNGKCLLQNIATGTFSRTFTYSN